ncbi:hypothetical protein ABMA28_006826 [Loxostege sticticalis]|uniref:THAP-type domain-containing protein n=1 Tax=Loxostege sticticalis TaxID=481309 RepID=A0ABD0TNI3_LOXSC
MVSCSVMDCSTTKRNNPGKFHFTGPTNLDMRKTWLKLINRPNWIPKKYLCICSKHFEEKLLQTRGAKRILMKSAIPTNIVPAKIKPRRTMSSYVYRDMYQRHPHVNRQ